MNTFDKALAKANKQQLKAIEKIDGPVMVIAGPGTGKTQTLALRIANILKKTQANPENILCLTFTDTASVNMFERLESYIGPVAYKVRINTFHSFCKYLIQSNLEKFPRLNDADQNLGELEKIEIIKEIVTKLPPSNILRNIKFQETNLGKISDKIKDLKREGFSVEEFERLIKVEKEYVSETYDIYQNFTSTHARKLTDEVVARFVQELAEVKTQSVYTRGVLELVKDLNNNTAIRDNVKKIFKKIGNETYFPRLEALLDVYRKYEEVLEEKGFYDYEDMIMMVLERLKIDEAFLADVREEFQYILIDEYQDTNTAQNKIVEIIGSYFKNPNIFVVGDDDQSIYRFQGASLENILYFSTLYGDEIELITLKDNYRSKKEILVNSRRVIVEANNRLEDEFEHIDKQLKPNIVGQGMVILKEAENETQEAIEIAKTIKDLLKDDQTESIGLIVTRNAQVETFAEVLAKNDIDYNSKSTQNPLDDENVANLIVIIRFLLDLSRIDLLQRILYMPYFDLDNFDVFKISNYASSQRLNLLALISSNELLKEAGVESHKFHELAKNFAELHALIKVNKAAVFFPELIKKLKILDKLINHDSRFASVHRINIIYEYIKSNQRTNSNFTLEDLIQKIDLAGNYGIDIFTESSMDGEAKVTISTVHSAKGLEFQHVFLPGMLGKYWEKSRGFAELVNLPASMNKQDYSSQDIDEKIRLFYVALTRAKDKLWLSYPKHDEKGKDQIPSMFISILGLKPVQIEADNESLMTILTPPKKLFSDTGEIYLKDSLKDYVISPTHFNSYRNCPHCFFLNKVLKMPSVMDESNAYGNAIHKSLNLFLSKYRRKGSKPELDYLLEVFELELRKQFYNTGFENYLEKGTTALKQFYEEKINTMKETSLPEVNFSRFNIRINEIPVKGMVDRIDFMDDGSNKVDVIDYKTGNYNSTKLSVKGRGDYYIQLIFYKLLIENNPKHDWKVGTSNIIYVEPDNSGKLQKDKSFTIPDSDVEWLTNELTSVYNSIMNLEFSTKGKECYTPELHNIDFKF